MLDSTFWAISAPGTDLSTTRSQQAERQASGKDPGAQREGGLESLEYKECSMLMECLTDPTDLWRPKEEAEWVLLDEHIH